MGFSYLTLGWLWFLISRDDIAEYGSLAGKLRQQKFGSVFVSRGKPFF